MTDLVKGYVAQNYSARTEVLYAVYPCGKIMKSNTLQMPNAHFNKKGRVWSETDAMPADAGFCGNYPKA